jgi:hypothetical protein
MLLRVKAVLSFIGWDQSLWEASKHKASGFAEDFHKG